MTRPPLTPRMSHLPPGLELPELLKMHHRPPPPNGESPFWCKRCGPAFSTKRNLKRHLGVHPTSSRAASAGRSLRTRSCCSGTRGGMWAARFPARLGLRTPVTSRWSPKTAARVPPVAMTSSRASAWTSWAPRTLRRLPAGPRPASQRPLSFARSRVRCPGRPGKVGPAPPVLQRQSGRDNGSVEGEA